MKRLKRITAVVLTTLLLCTTTAFATGSITTVYNAFTWPYTYKVVTENQLNQYVTSGWSQSMPPYNSADYTPMYSADGRIEFFPHANANAQHSVGWYYSPVATMYAADGRTEIVAAYNVDAYRNACWFVQPPALMRKGYESQYVSGDEIEQYRNDGWFVTQYAHNLQPLCTQIQNYISSKTGSHGIYIKNLNTQDVVIINDNQYASASIIKLFVMAGVYNEISYGAIQKTPQVQGLLNNMITVSDNYSSNRLVKLMGNGNYYNGFAAENAMSRSIGCINTNHLTLFSGYGDFVSYGKNSVSPVDCGILLEQIYNRTLVSPEYSNEMLSMLLAQQRRNKIPYLLPAGTMIANKTGETSSVQSDVGIVYSPGADYIICVITNNAKTGITDIRQISKMTYDYFN